MPRFNRSDYQMENGKLPAYAFPGGYPLYYLAADNGVLCRDCADSDRCKEADNDPFDSQYHIIGVDINHEDNDLRCDDCNTIIECAYPPDNETPDADDYIIADRRGGGYNVYRGGTCILTTTADGYDDLLPLIRGDMEEQQFWPTVWRERERGGFDVINTTTGDIVQ